MSGIAEQVVVLTRDDIHWPFSQQPYVAIPAGEYGYRRMLPIDPFPAYQHDRIIVARTLQLVQARAPLPIKPRIYLLPCEEPGRTNGATHYDSKWDYNVTPRVLKGWDARITLAAKRIPPHGSITRYLVAHEYGHVVARWLAYERGHGDDLEAFEQEYAALRDLTPPRGGERFTEAYGGGTWHTDPGELLACDFRILVARIETIYWPHPGVLRPEAVPAVRDFWSRVSFVEQAA